MIINGQMIQMQTATAQGSNQQFYVVQNAQQVNGQTNPSLLLTQQPQTSSQPLAVLSTAPSVNVFQSDDQPPTYEFCNAGQKQ